MSIKQIYCCSCEGYITPRKKIHTFTDRATKKQRSIRILLCKACKNHVGTHKGTWVSLGSIPTEALAIARGRLSKTLHCTRNRVGVSKTYLYNLLTAYLGWKFRVAGVNSIAQVDELCIYLDGIQRER